MALAPAVPTARSNPCSRRRPTDCRPTTAGCSSRSGTASGRSSSATATRSTRSRATSSRSIATSRSWPIRSGPRCPSGASSTARSSSPATAASTSRRCCCGSTRRRRGSRCWPRSRPRRSWPGTCSRSATRTCATSRRASDARDSRRSSARRAAADPPHAGDAATGRRPPTGSIDSRAPGSTASSPSGSTRAYQPGKRAMLKIKHQRTADCVVAGFRWHKNGPGTHIGSLLLGLFDDEGTLHHVGRHLVVHVGPPGGARRGAGAAARGRPRRPPVAEWAEWAGRARPTRPASACPARRRAGTAARTCRGSRSGRSASPRSRTTISRATASATGRRSSAGARTSRPSDCRYDQLEETAPYLLARDLRR